LIVEIQARHRQGRAITSAQNPDIEYAARKLFGGWTKTLIAAGFQPHKTRWNRERVISEIQQRSRQGRSLSSAHPANIALAAAAAGLFGSWSKARRAAEQRQSNANTPDKK